MSKLLTLWHKLKHEFMQMLPPTIFFFIAFSLLMLTQRLIEREYNIPLTKFGAVFIGALLVGKAVLVADYLKFVNKFPHKPLIYNIFWKSAIYFTVACIFRYLEEIIPLISKHEDFIMANQHLIAETEWTHFCLVMIWLAVLFLIYCTMRELIRVIGKDKVLQIFFGTVSNNELKEEHENF